MPKIEIYTKDYCPFCHRAKALLDQYGVAYEEFDLMERPELTEEMLKRSGGRRTVPQVFIDGVAKGGSDDLAALHRSGELKRLLKVKGAA